MRFNPGDKVWIDNHGGGTYPAGTYAGVLIAPVMGAPLSNRNNPCFGWWLTDIEGIPPVDGRYPFAHEDNMRRRYDPPNDWVMLCKLDEVKPSMPVEELA